MSNKAPLKVVIVMPLGELRGGSEQMLWHLVSQGQNRGVEWQVVFLQDGPMLQQVRDIGITTHLIRAGAMRDLARFVRSVAELRALIQREKADLVCNWIATAQLYGGPAAWLAGVPAIWYQLFVPVNKGWIDRLATLLPARRVIACSRAGADAQRLLTPQREVRVVYPGVELDRFDPSRLPSPLEARARLGLPAKGPIIGITGRLQRWKGMHVLLEAFPSVRERFPDATVVIVGGEHAFEPEYPQFLRREAERLKISDRVVFAGLQKNVPEWMQAMDVFVHASDREPFGIVIIEAMALGKPVVATDTAGPAEIITPDVHGFLTPYGDADALARSICRYLADPELARRMGQAAQLRAKDFAVSRYAQGIVDVCFEATQDSSEGYRRIPMQEGQL